MKKLSLYIFLVLMFCNVGVAGILDQKKYVCKTDSNLGMTEVSILKKYDSSYVIVSENMGFGMELVNFASIINDNLFYFSVDGAFETITMGDLLPVENNKRKFFSSTFLLSSDQSSIMQSNITRFDNAPNKIKTLDLTKDEINQEIEIFKNKKKVLDKIFSQSAEKIDEQSLGTSIFYCDIGEKIDESKSSAKPSQFLIETLYEGCISAAKSDNNLNERSIKHCKCYSNWFSENLNADEFNEYLHLSITDKRKFVEKNKNNIWQKCN